MEAISGRVYCPKTLQHADSSSRNLNRQPFYHQFTALCTRWAKAAATKEEEEQQEQVEEDEVEEEFGLQVEADGRLGGQTRYRHNDLEQDEKKALLCHSQHESTQHEFAHISHQAFVSLAIPGPSSEAAWCRWVNINHICFGWRELRNPVGLVGDTHDDREAKSIICTYGEKSGFINSLWSIKEMGPRLRKSRKQV